MEVFHLGQVVIFVHLIFSHPLFSTICDIVICEGHLRCNVIAIGCDFEDYVWISCDVELHAWGI